MTERDKEIYREWANTWAESVEEEPYPIQAYEAGLLRGRTTASPTLSRECPECNGFGYNADKEFLMVDCATCHATGCVWVYYTPEEYKAAYVELGSDEPVLDGDTAVWWLAQEELVELGHKESFWIPCILNEATRVPGRMYVLNLPGQPKPRDDYRHGEECRWILNENGRFDTDCGEEDVEFNRIKNGMPCPNVDCGKPLQICRDLNNSRLSQENMERRDG